MRRVPDGAWLILLLLAMALLSLGFAPKKVPCAISPHTPRAGGGVVLKDGLALVDINEADETLLAALPGIGEVLAERIARDRAQNGRFDTVERLTRVEGVGKGKLRALQARAYAGP